MNAIPVPFDLDDALETSRYLANVVNGADAETHRAPLRWTGWSDDTIFAATVRNRGTGGKGLEVLGSGGASVLQVTDSGLSATAAALVGNLSVGGTLGVAGAATLSSTLAVTSNATVGGTLGVSGAISGASLSTGAGAISGGPISGTTGTFSGALTGASLNVGAGAISGGDATLAGLAVDAPTLVVDKTNNRVGIGTATPAQALHVVGNADVDGALDVAGAITAAGLNVDAGTLQVDAAGNRVGIGKSPATTLDVNGTVTATGFSNGTVFRAVSNVGIGTSSPDAAYALDVNGLSIFRDNLALANAQPLQGLDSGGTARTIVEMTSGDVAQFGAGIYKTLVRGGSTAGTGVVIAESGGRLGFYGTAAQSKQSVTGSRGGNAALDSLLTALDQLGLISNNSS